MSDGFDAALLATDPRAWDQFVASVANGAYPQLSAWAVVKAANGWACRYVVAEGRSGPIGAQLLEHRIGPTPWAVGYAPRGPVAAGFDQEAVAALTKAVREAARSGGLSHVTIDPEVEERNELGGWLESAGWRRAPHVQPDRTRLIDLRSDEEALWADLRSKWRQYVGRARREGVAVVEGRLADLDSFYEIYVETARRAGFVHRAAAAYKDVFKAFSSQGAARLLFARLPDGEPVATLMLLHCGTRVIEPYGGMTDRGAATRANYLLKWEAIRSSREAGFATYDMWGLSHPGIEHFKAGFGGREVRWIGAYALITNPPVHAAVQLAQRIRVRLARRRQGVGTGPPDGTDAT